MALLDQILSAQGNTSANYLKGNARTLIKVERMELRDPSKNAQVVKPGFNVDGQILWSSDAQNQKGVIGRANDSFKFPQSALARVRRCVAAAATSKFAKPVDEATFGIAQNKGEDDRSYANRIVAEVDRLLGSQQPLKGALLTIITTENRNKTTGSTYTLFEAVVPTEDDLKAAGLL